VLRSCCGDASSDVRQSAFALLGDLARACAPHLRPAAPQLLAACLAHLEPGAITQQAMSACNNACWAAGERCRTLCRVSARAMLDVGASTRA
jgi:transportin-1